MEVLVEDCTVDEISLKYYKTKKNNKYGVKIRKIEKDIEEHSEIEELTEEESEIEVVIKKLIKGTVTPMTLRYIIEDMALEYICKKVKE